MSSSQSYSDLVANLTKDQILTKFPDVVKLSQITGSSSSIGSTNISEEIFQGHDKEQIKLMEELCIVLDYNDNAIGAGTKKLCHIMDNIEKGLLHRAFSVFLFNEEGKLLLQQRASEKITFADMWTNTCCSHPLAIPNELGQNNDLNSCINGVKFAAQRKLLQELGIESIDIPIDDFKFLTRIHYKAPSNGIWGEHEIDYILIIKSFQPKLNPNPNEVKDLKYVDSIELKNMFKDSNLKFTPWFKLICENYLFKWWDQLDNLENFTNNEIEHLL
ncbi:hypothetical protein WICMUC_000854 [Wickerhamomyces mucosus]|uniref:Isopentenyl-diphosphate Delta-isomerase n=1 Tax=Wickerhamomyces mucosus TaxID=1378264 RepID=A0A9P8PW89_9ASCO|nr:hypothetical protein WICMUC_000854 [Wickerhamomyces mucosus]